MGLSFADDSSEMLLLSEIILMINASLRRHIRCFDICIQNMKRNDRKLYFKM